MYIVTLATTLDDLILGVFDNLDAATEFAESVYLSVKMDSVVHPAVFNALNVTGRDYASPLHVACTVIENGIPVKYIELQADDSIDFAYGANVV